MRDNRRDPVFVKYSSLALLIAMAGIAVVARMAGHFGN